MLHIIQFISGSHHFLRKTLGHQELDSTVEGTSLMLNPHGPKKTEKTHGINMEYP